jgi:HAD superfamily hydrolase (TIGR01509 family)
VTAIGDPHSAVGPKAIIFDLDGVLIDSEALQYAAYAQVLARYGVTVSVEEYGTHWIAAGRGPEYAIKTYGLPLEPDELRELKHPVYHEILRREVTLMPGVVAALTRLHARFPLAVATNSNRQDVSFVMDRFDLQRFFAAIVTREDYQLPKPNPDAFLTAAARLGAVPDCCLVIEDAYKGIVAAHRAGATVVAVPNQFTRNNDFSLAATVLQSLDELTVEVVERLLAPRGQRDA